MYHTTSVGLSKICTFCEQFPLYTLMVFDDWRNGIPVGFVLTSRCGQEHLTPWMRALDDRMKTTLPGWQPCAFIVDCAQGEINSITYVSF